MKGLTPPARGGALVSVLVLDEAVREEGREGRRTALDDAVGAHAVDLLVVGDGERDEARRDGAPLVLAASERKARDDERSASDPARKRVEAQDALGSGARDLADLGDEVLEDGGEEDCERLRGSASKRERGRAGKRSKRTGSRLADARSVATLLEEAARATRRELRAGGRGATSQCGPRTFRADRGEDEAGEGERATHDDAGLGCARRKVHRGSVPWYERLERRRSRPVGPGTSEAGTRRRRRRTGARLRVLDGRALALAAGRDGDADHGAAGDELERRARARVRGRKERESERRPSRPGRASRTAPSDCDEARLDAKGRTETSHESDDDATNTDTRGRTNERGTKRARARRRRGREGAERLAARRATASCARSLDVVLGYAGRRRARRRRRRRRRRPAVRRREEGRQAAPRRRRRRRRHGRRAERRQVERVGSRRRRRACRAAFC